jgi:hypothetical protein
MASRPKTFQFVSATAEEVVAIKAGKLGCYSTEFHSAEQVVQALLDSTGTDTLLNPSVFHLVGCPVYDEAINPNYVKKGTKGYVGAPKFLHDISVAKFLLWLQGDGKDRVVFERNFDTAQFKWKKKEKAQKSPVNRLGGLSLK